MSKMCKTELDSRVINDALCEIVFKAGRMSILYEQRDEYAKQIIGLTGQVNGVVGEAVEAAEDLGEK